MKSLTSICCGIAEKYDGSFLSYPTSSSSQTGNSVANTDADSTVSTSQQEDRLRGSLSDSVITKISSDTSHGHTYDSPSSAKRSLTIEPAETSTAKTDAVSETSSSTVSLCMCAPRTVKGNGSYSKPSDSECSDVESSGISEVSSTTGTAYPSSSSGYGRGRSKSSTSVSSSSDTDSVTPTGTLLMLQMSGDTVVRHAKRSEKALRQRACPTMPLSKSPIGMIPPNQREIREALQNLRPSTPRSSQPYRSARSMSKTSSAPSSLSKGRPPTPRGHVSAPERDDSSSESTDCNESYHKPPSASTCELKRDGHVLHKCRFFLSSDSQSVGSFDFGCCSCTDDSSATTEYSNSVNQARSFNGQVIAGSNYKECYLASSELQEIQAFTEIDHNFKKDFDKDVKATSTPKTKYSKVNESDNSSPVANAFCEKCESDCGPEVKRDSWGKFVTDYQLNTETSSELSCHYLPSLDEDVSVSIRSGENPTSSRSVPPFPYGVNIPHASATCSTCATTDDYGIDSNQSNHLIGSLRGPCEFPPGIYKPALVPPGGFPVKCPSSTSSEEKSRSIAAHSWLHQGTHARPRGLSPVRTTSHRQVPKMHHSFDDVLDEVEDRVVSRRQKHGEALKRWLDEQFSDIYINQEDEVTHL